MEVYRACHLLHCPFHRFNCATKRPVLHSFTESLRVQLKNTKVKVFDLAPPATQTELLVTYSEDLKGASVMKVEKMVQSPSKECKPIDLKSSGQANQLKMMSPRGAWIYLSR